jgi:hypothetical protein
LDCALAAAASTFAIRVSIDGADAGVLAGWPHAAGKQLQAKAMKRIH